VNSNGEESKNQAQVLASDVKKPAKPRSKPKGILTYFNPKDGGKSKPKASGKDVAGKSASKNQKNSKKSSKIASKGIKKGTGSEKKKKQSSGKANRNRALLKNLGAGKSKKLDEKKNLNEKKKTEKAKTASENSKENAQKKDSKQKA
jgi:hypothetical protein